MSSKSIINNHNWKIAILMVKDPFLGACHIWYLFYWSYFKNSRSNDIPAESVKLEFNQSKAEKFRAILKSVSKLFWIIPTQSEKMFKTRSMQKS